MMMLAFFGKQTFSAVCVCVCVEGGEGGMEGE